MNRYILRRMTKRTLDPAYLRQQIVGVDSTFETPFGERLMVYCDYTASGRCLRFVESYLQSLQRVYANTHTEDDITGRSMSQLLHEAEQAIKDSVNAGPNGRIVAAGTGATGAIDKLQQIVGVALPPATRRNLYDMLDKVGPDFCCESFKVLAKDTQPVVFVGPYEHHSNEISWRLSLAKTVEVRLDARRPDRSRTPGTTPAGAQLPGAREDWLVLRCVECDRHEVAMCVQSRRCCTATMRWPVSTLLRALRMWRLI